ncbi:glycosyl hydrolase family 28 protein [Verrucomicrobiota bacterium]
MTESFNVYSVPAEEVPATDYALSVNCRPVFTHPARVSAYPVNVYCPPFQRPLAQTEIASFASWDMGGPVEVEVKSRRPVQSVTVRPLSAGVSPRIDGDSIRFAIARPSQYTVEVNDSHQALHLFANPPEEAAPDPKGPDVLYFGPGVHCAGLIRMQSGQTLYVAAGAIVHGAVVAEHAQNITICGRGILDGSTFARESLASLILLYHCENVRIEDIVLRDSGVFTLTPVASREVHIRHVKVIGNWRYNSDGIDFLNCRSCTLEDSFIRTFDDSLCVKGWRNFGAFIYRMYIVEGCGPMDRRFVVDGVEGTLDELQERFGDYPCPQDTCRDIQVRRCVIWCDWGRPLEIGAKTQVDEIRDLLFEDCDLIHSPGCCAVMSVQNSDRALCRDLLYRNIRVELDDQPSRPVIVRSPDEPYEKPYDGYLPTLIRLSNQVGYVSSDCDRGRIEDIRFENIAPAMPPSQLRGFDEEHPVQRVTVANLSLNGRLVTDLENAGMQMNEFVRDVALRDGGE